MQRLHILGLLTLALLLCTPLLHAGEPAKGVHPVVDLNCDENTGYSDNFPDNEECGYLFGGSVNGKWIDGETIIKKMARISTYHIYSTEQCLGNGTAVRPEVPEVDGGWESPSVVMTLPNNIERKQAVIGIVGGWNALPRIPREQNVNQATYLKVVSDFLITQGQLKAKANITRLLRIDLEGDGTEEVLICAVTPNRDIILPEDGQADGDYSLILVRKLLRGKVITIPLAKYFFDGNAGAENLFTLVGTFDVNGDGILEILVRYQYHEGFGSTLYSLKGTKVDQVLDAGNGV